MSLHIKFDDDRMVQKLLVSLFCIENALKAFWSFGGFNGENCNSNFLYIPKGTSWPKTRVLTYYSPKSVYAFD